jgi:hypothetical protein
MLAVAGATVIEDKVTEAFTVMLAVPDLPP